MSTQLVQTLASAYGAVFQSGMTIWGIVFVSLSLFIGSRFLKYHNDLSAVGHTPGFRVLSSPLHIFGAMVSPLLPMAPWNPGIHYVWFNKKSVYKTYGNDTISMVSYLFGAPAFYTSNVDILRQVAGGGHKTSFEKPFMGAAGLRIWGMNLVAAEREVWRRHRRIIGPAFNNELYQMVWDQTLDIYNAMIAGEGWTDKKTVDVPVVQSLTFKVALLVIGQCGFGFNFSWTEPARAVDGSMSIQEALQKVSETHLIQLFIPKWMQRLPYLSFQGHTFREARQAAAQVMNWMRAQVKARKEEVRLGTANGRDAFTMLVKANEDEETKLKLDDSELIGNVYVMLFAGHETTAQTLAATLAFMAINPEIQDEVYQQILSVVGTNADPGYDDYSKLNKVLAIFYESLRHFPSANILIREAFEDTVLQIPNPVSEGGITAHPIKKGTQVLVDMVGVQNNDRYFDQPFEYKPSRWYNASSTVDASVADNEEFTAFSVGPRACIGRKFASLEGVCFLTCLLRDWKVTPLLQDGETQEAWSKKVFEGQILMTLGIKEVPVTFTRRF